LRRPPANTRSSLRSLAPALALAALIALLLAPSALAQTPLLTPQTGSPNADRISDLYIVTLVIAAIIFAIVEGTLIYALIRFRKRKGRVAAQIHGNTRLEIGWTVGASLILVALATLTFVELNSIRQPDVSSANGLHAKQIPQLVSSSDTSSQAIHPPKGPYLTIQVNGQQYLWRYIYLNYGKTADQLDDPFSSYQMVVPTNTTIVLKVLAQDVVHSWWVPQLGGKIQAVPGYLNWGWFKIAKPGNYFGACAFLCGLGHARMKAEVTAIPPAQFVTWIDNQRKQIEAANAAQKKARAQQQNDSGSGTVTIP
jgi:cytochrome c oxidase subunit II